MISVSRVDVILNEGINDVLRVTGNVIKLLSVLCYTTDKNYPRLNIQVGNTKLFPTFNTERNSTGIEPYFLYTTGFVDTKNLPKIVQYDTGMDRFTILYEPESLIVDSLYIFLYADSSVAGDTATIICAYEEE